MKKEDLSSLKLSDLNTQSEHTVKNLIISNNVKDPVGLHFSLDHPFSFDGISFCLCISGEAKIRINFIDYQLEKNSIMIILPQHILEAYEQSEDCFIEVLAFSHDFVNDMPLPKDMQIPNKIILNPLLKLEEENMQTLLHYYTFIVEIFETKKDSFYLDEMIKGLLYSLLMQVATLYHENAEEYSKSKNSRNEELADQFFILLFEHYKKERNVSFYADKICVSPKHLSSVLKKVTGHTINSWIDNAVIMGAKSLLKCTTNTVLQISEDLNFPTPSYFGRFFKRETGMTPLEYRESK